MSGNKNNKFKISYWLTTLFVIIFATSSIIPAIAENESINCEAHFSFYVDNRYNYPNHFYFLNQSAGNIAYYMWNFDDGTTSNEINPSHTFVEAGEYQVCLSVFCFDTSGNIICTNTECQQIRVEYNIGGHVFADYLPVDQGIAYLYKLAYDMFTLYTVSCFDTLGYYYFYQIPAGEYIIKTRPAENSIYFSDYIPTYYGDALFWEDAQVISVGGNNWELNINLLPYPDPCYGGCSVSGEVIVLETWEPLGGAEVLLTTLDEIPVACCFSDESGFFEFENVGFGSFMVMAEITGVTMNPVYVTLDPQNTNITGIELVVSLNSPVVVNDHTVADNTFISDIYPNPVTSIAYVTISSQKDVNIGYSIHHLSGATLYKTDDQSIGEGRSIQINIDHLAQGFYLIKFYFSDGTQHTRKFVKINP